MNACTLPDWAAFLNAITPFALAVVGAVAAAVLRSAVKENTRATVDAGVANLASREVETAKVTTALVAQTNAAAVDSPQ